MKPNSRSRTALKEVCGMGGVFWRVFVLFSSLLGLFGPAVRHVEFQDNAVVHKAIKPFNDRNSLEPFVFQSFNDSFRDGN